MENDSSFSTGHKLQVERDEYGLNCANQLKRDLLEDLIAKFKNTNEMARREPEPSQAVAL